MANMEYLSLNSIVFCTELKEELDVYLWIEQWHICLHIKIDHHYANVSLIVYFCYRNYHQNFRWPIIMKSLSLYGLLKYSINILDDVMI